MYNILKVYMMCRQISSTGEIAITTRRSILIVYWFRLFITNVFNGMFINVCVT